MILSNELPKLGDASGALVGRMILLRFNKSFFGVEDHGLFDALESELPGILLWAAAGWKRLNARRRFVQPGSGRQLIRDLEDTASPVAAFMREKCFVKKGERIAKSDLFNAWKEWCESEGENIGCASSFSRQLTAAFPDITTRRPKQSGERWREYDGIRLRSGFDKEDDLDGVHTFSESVDRVHAFTDPDPTAASVEGPDSPSEGGWVHRGSTKGSTHFA